MAPIYVIGDSHVFIFSGQLNGLRRKLFFNDINIPIFENKIFQIFHCGPALAYSLNKYNTNTRITEKSNFLLSCIIKPGATIVMSFGEIDIRCHILKQIDVYKSAYIVADNYIKYIKSISDKYKVIIYSPIATGKDCGEIDKNYPRVGTEAERNTLTKIFNNIIKEAGIPYFSVFEEMISDNLETRNDFLAPDNCHLSFEKYNWVLDKFKTKFSSLF